MGFRGSCFTITGPAEAGENPIEFLSGFKGLLHCDGYSAYGRIEDVVLVCCLAHCRRKFYEAVPTGRRKKLKLLDINSEEELKRAFFRNVR